MMTRTAIALGGLALAMALSISDVLAAGVSVTNRDDKDHKLTVIEEDGAKKTDHTLKANQVLESICPKGCVIRLNDSEEDEYELEGTEKVSIEDGYLYYDEAPAAETPQGPAGAAPAPGTPPAAAPPEKK